MQIVIKAEFPPAHAGRVEQRNMSKLTRVNPF